MGMGVGWSIASVSATGQHRRCRGIVDANSELWFVDVNVVFVCVAAGAVPCSRTVCGSYLQPVAGFRSQRGCSRACCGPSLHPVARFRSQRGCSRACCGPSLHPVARFRSQRGCSRACCGPSLASRVHPRTASRRRCRPVCVEHTKLIANSVIVAFKSVERELELGARR